MDFAKIFELKENDQKWYLVLSGLIVFIFYAPPVDLISKVGEHYSRCLHSIIIIPLAISFWLILIFLSKYWKRWKIIFFARLIPLLLIMALFVDTIHCYSKSETNNKTANINLDSDANITNSNCNCFASNGKKLVKVKYIPKTIVENSNQTKISFKFQHSTLDPEDSLMYQTEIYKNHDSNISLTENYNYYFSIQPNVLSNTPFTFSEIGVQWFLKRLKILINSIGKVILRKEVELNYQSFPQYEIPISLISNIEKYTILDSRLTENDSKISENDSKRELLNEFNGLSNLNNLIEFESKLNFLSSNLDYLKINGNNSAVSNDSIEKSVFFSLKDLIKDKDLKIKNLEEENTLLKSNKSEEEKSIKILLENQELRDQIKIFEQSKNDQKSELQNESKAFTQPAMKQIDVENKFDTPRFKPKFKGLIIATYNHKGKAILIRKNQTHKLKDIENIYVEFDCNEIHLIHPKLTIRINNDDKISQIIYCDEGMYKTAIPSNYLRKGDVEIYIKGADASILLISFKIK